MIPHSCEWCSARKARRRLVALLHQQPNITSTRAAERLCLNRAYVTGQRVQLEQRGCVPKRTVDGRQQRHVEWAMDAAQTTGGHPIAHTTSGDVEAVLEAYRPRPAVLERGFAIGSVWAA